MSKKLYNKFIAPRERNPDTRNRIIVLNVLLAGTLLILIATCLILAYDIFVIDLVNLKPQALSILGATLSIGLLYWFSRHGRHKLAAVLLVSLYFLIGSLVTYTWGILVPTGVLVFGLVITLGGILLGPSFSLYMAAASSLMIFGLQLTANYGIIHPDWSWLQEDPTLGDALSIILIFVIMAVVSWMFNFQMDRSLHRAVAAETALTKQKALLETTVVQRTRELQATQVEKTKQMYRFAELGQLSTALMHELANHLTSLTLDIEGLQGQGRGRAVNRAKRSIRYIDDMVVRVRDQLHGGKIRTRPFNVVDEMDAVVKMLRHKAQAADVLLKWRPPANSKTLRVKGEPVRLRQLLANLISNGIDAYYEPRDDTDEKRDVEIQIDSDSLHIIITISDWGRGIPEPHAGKLFEPFFSTKATGMGMGLYISKQVVIEHFLGDIKVVSTAHPTSFVVTLPKAIP